MTVNAVYNVNILFNKTNLFSMYSAMHKKRYKFYIQDFYAQKSLKICFS